MNTTLTPLPDILSSSAGFTEDMRLAALDERKQRGADIVAKIDAGDRISASERQELTRINNEIERLHNAEVVRLPIHSTRGRRSPRATSTNDMPLLASHEPIAPHFKGEGGDQPGVNVRLGTLIAALVGGPKVVSQFGADEYQALTGLGTLTGPGGAYLISGSVAAEFLDSVRPTSRVIEAGAQTYPMRGPDVHFPGWDTPLTASWRAEGSAFTAVTPPFRKVNLHAKSVGCEVVLTQEMLEDADTNLAAVETIVEEEVARAIGQAIDLAALVGSGVDNQPLGVANAGVTTDSTLGANGSVPADYDFLLEAYGLVQSANFDPTAVLYSARTAKTLSKLKTGLTSDKTQLAIPEPLKSTRRLTTNQIGDTFVKGTSGAVCSLAFTGQWDQLVIGLRNELSVLFDPFSKSSTGEVKLTVWQRADVALLNKGAFIVSDGIKA